MPARPAPRRHWRSYGNDPLPSGKEALDEPFSAFPSWFLRIECDRCGKVRWINEVHMKDGAPMPIRDILDRMRHDGCGGRAGKAELAHRHRGDGATHAPPPQSRRHDGTPPDRDMREVAAVWGELPDTAAVCATAEAIENKTISFAAARDAISPPDRKVAPLGLFDRARVRLWLDAMAREMAPIAAGSPDGSTGQGSDTRS